MNAFFPTLSTIDFRRISDPAGTPWIAGMAHSLRGLLTPCVPSVSGLLDPATGLDNHAGLIARAGALLKQARREQRPLGLVVLDFDDLLEVRTIYGAEMGKSLGRHVVKKLKQIAGLKGHVARTGKAQFAILLPGYSTERALKAVHRVLGYPARVELDVHGEEIVLIPDFLARDIAGVGESIVQLHADMLLELETQRIDEARRCHYLQKERESHSRPMSFAEEPGDSGKLASAACVRGSVPVASATRA